MHKITFILLLSLAACDVERRFDDVLDVKACREVCSVFKDYEDVVETYYYSKDEDRPTVTCFCRLAKDNRVRVSIPDTYLYQRVTSNMQRRDPDRAYGNRVLWQKGIMKCGPEASKAETGHWQKLPNDLCWVPPGLDRCWQLGDPLPLF
jgi:hypothetical protein